MKAFRQTILFLLTVSVLFSIAVITIGIYYEDDIKLHVTKSINNKLATEVNVSSIDLDLWSKFPNISIRLQDAFARDALIKVHNKDTLFYFEKVFLQFNALNILNQSYIISELTLQEGVLNVVIDKTGAKNYEIFKGNSNGGSSLELEKVLLKSVKLQYNDEGTSDKLNLLCNKVYLKGAFAKNEFKLDIDGSLYSKEFSIANQHYLKQKAIDLDVALMVNANTHRYAIQRGNIELDKRLKLGIKGIIQSIENNEGTSFELIIDSPNLNIEKSTHLLPKNIQEYILEYKAKGKVDLSIQINGVNGVSSKPEVKASFKINDGSLTHKDHGLTFNQLSLNGNYSSNGNFSIKNMFAISETDTIRGEFISSGNKHPKINLKLIGNARSTTLAKLTKMDSITNINGKIRFNIDAIGTIQDPNNIRYSDYEKMQTKGTITVEKLAFNIKNNRRNFTDINAKLHMKGNDITIEQLSGKIDQSDFSCTGTFLNILSYMFLDNQVLQVDAKLQSKLLDFNELLSANSTETGYYTTIPNNITLNLTSDIDSLIFRKFNASQIHGEVRVHNQRIIVSPLQFNAMQGNFDGEAFMSFINPEQYTFKVNSTLENIDIKTLFYQLEDFDQSTLTHNHLKGKANFKMQYVMRLDPNLNIDLNSIKSDVDIQVNQGEISNFTPLIETVDYIKENKILRTIIQADELEQRLHTVKFKTLKNHIQIHNKTIQIPHMTVESDAIDIDLEGTHTFDNYINYRLSFYLSDLLISDAAERDKKGKTKIYLIMTGPMDDPEISYDKASAKKGIKKEVAKEKQEVKGILKEELGLFKNDTTVAEPETENEKLNYSIEWDEMENEPATKEEESGQKKKGLKGLLNPNQKKKKSSDDFNFEDDDF